LKVEKPALRNCSDLLKAPHNRHIPDGALIDLMRAHFTVFMLGLLLWLMFGSIGRAQGSGTWETRAPMPVARQELATGALNGKVYVIGGYDGLANSTATVEVYNPITDTWAFAHPIPFSVNHNSAAVAGGKLYSFGAGAGEVFVYDPNEDSWSGVASTHYIHSRTAAVGVIDGKIYVAGGTGTPTEREVEMYDPLANTWTIKASMSAGRNHTAGGVINGKFYVVGGRLGRGSTNVLEVYDPRTNTWSTRAPMPTIRSGIAAAVVNDELWVFGGEDVQNQSVNAEVEVYNPATDSWRQLPDMPLPRHGIWASVIGNKIYIPGGGAAADIAATNTNQIFTVTSTLEARLGNISTRAFVRTGDNVMIGGFIVQGTTPKRVIIRAIGPELSQHGVPNPLADPTLELHDGTRALIASNNNWQTTIIGGIITQDQVHDIQNSGHAPTAATESAIIASLPPGNYTAIVRGVNSTTGVALVEVYDLSPDASSILGNISTRSFVQTGDEVMIGGFIVQGTTPKSVIIRAIGPELNQHGVPNPLADPTLELHDGTRALIASNNNWQTTIIGGIITQDQVHDIQNSGHAPTAASESAIAANLPPGNYTAIVRGVNSTTGVGLVEVYDLQP
jgi:N-acetylneuraminic acid mutarotase